MRKRLRKKLHRGEFRERAFLVEFRLASGLDEPGRNAFLDRFVDAVEAQHLGFTGGGGDTWSGALGKLGRGSATEADRAYVEAWLRAEPAVVEPSVGPLKDSWYGTW